MSDMFDSAVQIVLVAEGKLSDNPADAGGLTKYGISQQAYPTLDIASLTVAQATEIYRQDYWDKVRGDELAWTFALPLFDCAVNQGVDAAIRFFQAALKVSVDGVFGAATLQAATQAAAADPTDVLARLMAQRIAAYSQLSSWATFGDGWTQRCFKIALAAIDPPPAAMPATS